MQYGIIGYGKMGIIRHNALKNIGAGTATKIYEVNPVTEHQELCVDNYEDILNDSSIDAVIICTPNFLNKKLTIEALKKGKHVFCEKPPAFNATEMQDIIQVEKTSNKVLCYGFNHRHHGGSSKMSELIKTGNYGRILWMRGRYGKSVDEDYFKGWRSDPSLSGGGILLDQGIHMLDLFLQIGGQFDDVKAFVSNLYWNMPGIEDNVFAIMRNSQTGMCASLHSTMTQWRHLFSFEIFLEKGYMVLNGLKTPSGTYGSEMLTVAKNRSQAPAATWEDEEKFEYDVDHSWEIEMKNFLKMINSKSTPLFKDSHEALKVMQLIDDIYNNECHQSDVLFNKLNGATS
ncbi:MAG: Gfo/Idh/MocA family oxidoreductase [Pseudomonadota bacterium]